VHHEERGDYKSSRQYKSRKGGLWNSLSAGEIMLAGGRFQGEGAEEKTFLWIRGWREKERVNAESDFGPKG